MAGKKRKRASVFHQVAAFVGFILAIGIGLFIGAFTTGGLGTGGAGEPKEEAFSLSKVFLEIFAGLVFLGGAAFLYGLTVLTQCFTFSYQNPVFRGFKGKLFIVNILFLVALILGAMFIGGAILDPILAGAGLPPQVGVLILAFVILSPTVFVGIWTPMDRPLVTKRLRAKEVPDRAIEKGQLAGISNPKKNSPKKFPESPDDVGMLWFLKNRIIYRGDNDEFEIRRGELVDMERKTDRRSSMTLGGGVPIILTFRRNDEERKVRLVPRGCWTVWSLARELDNLADKIERWQEAGEAIEAPAEAAAHPDGGESPEPGSVPD